MSNLPQGAATDSNAPYNDRKPNQVSFDRVILWEGEWETIAAIVPLTITDWDEEEPALKEAAKDWCKSNGKVFAELWEPDVDDWKTIPYITT